MIEAVLLGLTLLLLTRKREFLTATATIKDPNTWTDADYELLKSKVPDAIRAIEDNMPRPPNAPPMPAEDRARFARMTIKNVLGQGWTDLYVPATSSLTTGDVDIYFEDLLRGGLPQQRPPPEFLSGMKAVLNKYFETQQGAARNYELDLIKIPYGLTTEELQQLVPANLRAKIEQAVQAQYQSYGLPTDPEAVKTRMLFNVRMLLGDVWRSVYTPAKRERRLPLTREVLSKYAQDKAADPLNSYLKDAVPETTEFLVTYFQPPTTPVPPVTIVAPAPAPAAPAPVPAPATASTPAPAAAPMPAPVASVLSTLAPSVTSAAPMETTPAGADVTSIASLEQQYELLRIEYKSLIDGALSAKTKETLDPLVQKILALNTQLTDVLDKLVARLAIEESKGSDEFTTKRNQFASRLATIKQDYTGLLSGTDQMITLRRIREYEEEKATTGLKYYLIAFGVAVSLLIVVIVLKMFQPSKNRYATNPMETSPTTSPPFNA